MRAISTSRKLIGAMLFGACLLVTTASQAHWHGGWGWGGGWHHGWHHGGWGPGYGGVVVTPGYGYYNCGWIPGHWRYGYWIPAHRNCW